jgi:SAM-dependent methyltransferase
MTFRCRVCDGEIRLDADSETTSCPSCSAPVPTTDGILDFVTGDRTAGERAYYDAHYAARRQTAPETLDLLALRSAWQGKDAPPERRAARRRLGSLAGKRVLLLGNGESTAELYLLTGEPSDLVYSDLSPFALRNIRDRFAFDGTRRNLVFAAIDAYDMPFFDESIDLIWGFAFVHHLRDVDMFLAECARVLRPGGRSVFMDDGYSPFWQWLKLGALRPLMRVSHRRDPRSPEDVQVTVRGGFREVELAEMIRALGCRPWFERQGFLHYLWQRATVSLFPSELAWLARRRSIGRALIHVDEALARLPPVRGNLVRLIWGFDRLG